MLHRCHELRHAWQGSSDIVDEPASQLFLFWGAGFLVIWGLGG